MKAFIIRPIIDVYDGSGILSSDAAATLHAIAEMVADSLQQGGDRSHHAATWFGPTHVDTPPNLVALSDRQSLLALTFKLLDPNDLLEGDIRSLANCRTATFGQDGQAMLCLRHEDAMPTATEVSLITVTECSNRLAGTDSFDGSWPPA